LTVGVEGAEALYRRGELLGVQKALARMEQQRAEEKRRRQALEAEARQGSVEALQVLFGRYRRYRLPMVEAQLPPEQRARLPWLKKDGNGEE
jgi:muconolactone delta-isomerase